MELQGKAFCNPKHTAISHVCILEVNTRCFANSTQAGMALEGSSVCLAGNKR